MNTVQSFAVGLLGGAGLMYLVDPDGGRRRRALLRDRAAHTGSRVGDGLGMASRDLRNRSGGIVARTRARTRTRFRHDDVSDEVVEQRVRTEMGRVVSHPRAVGVSVQEGRVTLAGPVLAAEADALLKRVRGVHGVTEVSDELERHEHPEHVPALQGGVSRSAPPELLRENWAPSTRVLVGTAATAALVQGMRRRDATGMALGALGLVLLARAGTNLPARRLVGAASGRQGIEVRKTLNLAARPEEVWALWSNFENFPRFMSHLREVRDVGEGRTRWVAVGPAGVPVEWEAVVTEWVPNERIAWRSEEGAAVENAGSVHFRPLSNERTAIDIRMSYHPPAGALGHAVAALFGVDPKRAMDADLVRLKSLLEEGKTRAAGGTVRREEVVGWAPREATPTFD